jgi:PhnB protein
MENAGTQIIPYIMYRDVPAALEWLARAFGFEERLREPTPNGMHAEMVLDGQRIMMGQNSANAPLLRGPAEDGRATMAIFVYLPDVDAHHARAAAAGAAIDYAPHDQPYGRTYAARDLDGHPWYFTTPPKVA